MIALADITHHRPTDHALLANLCQLTAFLEEVAAIINDDKPRRLHGLFMMIREVYSQLSKWGESVGIGTMTGMETAAKTTAALVLHNGQSNPVCIAMYTYFLCQRIFRSSSTLFAPSSSPSTSSRNPPKRRASSGSVRPAASPSMPPSMGSCRFRPSSKGWDRTR